MKFWKIVALLAVALIGASVFYSVAAEGKTAVEIRENAPWFFPAVLEIQPGATVTWVKKTAAVHPVMSLEGPSEFHSGHFTREWSYKFDKPGVYVYICPVHPYMKGVIGVGAKVAPEKIPFWAQWPPEEREPPSGAPGVAGVGRVWLDAQFHEIAGKQKPGSIVIINAETWQVEKVIDDPSLNNPHNMAEWRGKILQTNWFDRFLGVFNKQSGEFERQVLVGESPAHVMGRPQGDKVYVTIQGDDGLAILGEGLEVVERVRAPKGPHGHWLSGDGKLMALAGTENGSISVWDLEKDEIVFERALAAEGEMRESVDEKGEKHVHSLPLMAGITRDGRYAFAATSATGKFFVFDVQARKLLKYFDVGSGPIQVVPAPDDKHVLVPLSGSGEVAVVSTENWELVKKIPGAGRGAHAVAYGRKQGGGWYAYVSSKFELWMAVIDLESLEVAGYVKLPDGAWGGQGILTVE